MPADWQPGQSYQTAIDHTKLALPSKVNETDVAFIAYAFLENKNESNTVSQSKSDRTANQSIYTRIQHLFFFETSAVVSGGGRKGIQIG